MYHNTILISIYNLALNWPLPHMSLAMVGYATQPRLGADSVKILI